MKKKWKIKIEFNGLVRTRIFEGLKREAKAHAEFWVTKKKVGAEIISIEAEEASEEEE